jgi:hypothetical protein
VGGTGVTARVAINLPRGHVPEPDDAILVSGDQARNHPS